VSTLYGWPTPIHGLTNEGADSWSTWWTPSSPHSTSSQTTSARGSPTPAAPWPPEASLWQGELITLAIFARWSRDSRANGTFTALLAATLERGIPYPLPDRSQFNRLVRFYADTSRRWPCASGADDGGDSQRPYQALDASAMPVRHAKKKRRGHGWLLGGRADIGWSNSLLGWYEGFSLLTAVEPSGLITGFCFGAASTADQPLAETFFAIRAQPNPRLPSAGPAACGVPYITDKGFEGAENHRAAGSSTMARRSSIHPSATPRSPGGPRA
jgi:hypothetical protein